MTLEDPGTQRLPSLDQPLGVFGEGEVLQGDALLAGLWPARPYALRKSLSRPNTCPDLRGPTLGLFEKMVP